MKLNQKQASMFKGITTEGPNKLNRKGNPLKFKKHRKNKRQNIKNKKILSIKSNSQLRNQLASLRQSTRPVVNQRQLQTDHKRSKKQKKKKNSGLVQALQWNKAKSSKESFGKLTKRSLLFSIESLHKIDKITIYYIGKSGLQQLTELNHKFERYKDTLFDEKRVLFGGTAQNKISFDRSANNNDKDNQFIDNEIISLLRDLTDYFLLEECHKVLEFLIRQYKIHLNYPLFALECCFPYYSTITFARFIQLMEFNQHKWQILFLNVQKNLTPLNKQILIKQCLKDYSILQFIQEMHFNNAKSQVIKQFYTEIMLNLLNYHFNQNNHPKKANKLLLQIMPNIVSYIQFDSTQIVLNFISSRTTLNPSQIHEIINALMAKWNENKPELNQRLVLTLDYIMDSQNIDHISTQNMDKWVSLHNGIQILVALNDKFNIKLPLMMTNQLIKNVKNNNETQKQFLNTLLLRYNFQKRDKIVICNTLLDVISTDTEVMNHMKEVIDIIKNKYCEALNHALWDNKQIINSNLMDILISNNNLQNVLRSSLMHNNDDITNGIIGKIEHEFEHKRLSDHQMTDLLTMCLYHNADNIALKEKVLHILFENKTTLMNINNATEIIKGLLLILKSHNFHILWNKHELISNLFECLCFGIKMMENENDDEYIHLIRLSNCGIIDIFSNIPIGSDNKQQYVASLLHILVQYPSPKILITAGCIHTSSDDMNIDNILQKIGENMLLHADELVHIIPYLSIHSKCLLLLCLKQIINTNNSGEIIDILLKISQHLTQESRENVDVATLICSVFDSCIQLKLTDDSNDNHSLQILISLIPKHKKDQGNAIKDRLLQILLHYKGVESIKLLLRFMDDNHTNRSKATCLYLLSVLLEKYDRSDYKSELCSIVASVLFHLHAVCKSVRFCAVQCFKNIKTDTRTSTDDDDKLVEIMLAIRNYENDIVEDSKALHRICCNSSMSFDDVLLPIMKLFVDHEYIHYKMLHLFVPIVIEHTTKENESLIRDISKDMCKYMMTAKQSMQSKQWLKCILLIAQLLTHGKADSATIHSIEFDYINKWISEHRVVGILALLTDEYWKKLSFVQQKQLYLNVETLFEENHHQQDIIQFVLSVSVSPKMIKFWLRHDVNRVKLMTRTQFVISKINNGTINNYKHINNTLIPSILSLLKQTHLKMNMDIDTDKETEDATTMKWDDLDDVNMEDLIVIATDKAKKDERKQKNKCLEELESLNWIRSILLSSLIHIVKFVGDKLVEKRMDMDILSECMEYEWLLKSPNNLFIELICILGTYLPKLLLKIYVPFLRFMTNNMKNTDSDVVFLSILSGFFESSIGCIAPLLNANELRNVIQASISLLNELRDSHLRLQYASMLLKSLIPHHKTAVYIAFDIMYREQSFEDIHFGNRLLFTSTNNNIDLQLDIILNMLDSVALKENEENRSIILQLIAAHLNHSVFIKEFSTIVLENNDVIPSTIDSCASTIFKQLFDLLHDNDNDNDNVLIHECLDYVRGLLSLHSFTFIIRDLIFEEKYCNKKYRKYSIWAVQLLADQMEQKSEKFKLNDVKCYLKQLIIPLYNSKMDKTKEMDQRIICILDLMIKKWHGYSAVRDWFMTVIPSLIARLQGYCDNNEHKVMICDLLLLLSSGMRILKKSMLSHLSAIMSINLKILSKEEEANELLTISAIFCLECIVCEYSVYIGPYLDEILGCVLSDKYLNYASVASISLYITATMESIASFKSLKLIESLRNTFDLIVDSNASMVIFEAYFDLIRRMLSGWKTRKDTTECYLNLFDLFKHCMDIRVLSSSKNVDKFEFIILDCFSCLVLKLTDKEMMDIMERLIFWIDEFHSNSPKYQARTLSLFRFLCHCLHRFKATFCKIALFAYNLAVNCLQNEGFQSIEEEPPNKKQKLVDGTHHIRNNKLMLIQRSNYIMQTIQLTLKHGKKERLIDKATYLMLLPIIVDQMKQGVILRDELMFIAYFEKYITPTVVCLANTTKDINLWNQLNKRILVLSGHKRNVIRSAAVDALLGLFSLMGHSWLNCLPETLHYINELVQDNDEDVVQRTKTLVQRIELLTQSKLNNLT